MDRAFAGPFPALEKPPTRAHPRVIFSRQTTLAGPSGVAAPPPPPPTRRDPTRPDLSGHLRLDRSRAALALAAPTPSPSGGARRQSSELLAAKDSACDGQRRRGTLRTRPVCFLGDQTTTCRNGRVCTRASSTRRPLDRPPLRPRRCSWLVPSNGARRRGIMEGRPARAHGRSREVASGRRTASHCCVSRGAHRPHCFVLVAALRGRSFCAETAVPFASHAGRMFVGSDPYA